MPEWWEDRTKFLGATDIAAVLGVDPYRSALQVSMEKRGEVDPPEVTAVMRRGLRMEPLVAEMYSEEKGVSIVKAAPLMLGTAHAPLVASPDYYVTTPDGEVYLLEIKTHSPWLRETYGDEGTDAVPYKEIVQTQWQMHCSGLKRADIAVLFGLDDLAVFTVRYDPELGAAIEQTATDFWTRFVVGDEVPPASAPVDNELLARRYPESAENTVWASEEVSRAAADLRKTRRQLAELEAEADGLKAFLKQQMGEAAVLDCHDLGTITWRASKPTTRAKCDFKRLAADYPTAYDECVTETTAPGVRRFCVPRAWGGGED